MKCELKWKAPMGIGQSEAQEIALYYDRYCRYEDILQEIEDNYPELKEITWQELCEIEGDYYDNICNSDDWQYCCTNAIDFFKEKKRG